MHSYVQLRTILPALLALVLIGCGGQAGQPTQNQPQPSAVAAVQLAVVEAGSGTGTVTSSPAGINCGPTCSASFAPGTSVVLTAEPSKGFVFDGWSGACSGTGSCTVTVSSSDSVTATFSTSLQAINHIIFMAQENRGFLHYFGALPKYWADHGYAPVQFDGLPQFNTPPGLTPSIPGCDPAFPPPADCHWVPNVQVQSFHLVTKCVENLSSYWTPAHYDYNYVDNVSGIPMLDGFVAMAAEQARPRNYNDVNGIRAIGYYTGDDLNYYYYLASNFATSDRWFSPIMSDTTTNRMYMLAGTSSGHIRYLPPGSSTLNNETIFEALDKAGISWRVYVSDPNPTLLAGSVMAMYSFSYNHQQNFVPVAQFATDAASGNLPQVAMIEPGYQDGTDEHPFETPNAPSGSVQVGAQTVSKYIGALMKSPSWKNSVFILTWDEFGGFYDDVPPQPAVKPDNLSPVDITVSDACSTHTGPTCDFVYTGYRIPLLVVSPFTKKHYVSHTVADSTAILKFIETRFNLNNLTQRDLAQMDMTEFFDFINVPWSTPPTPPAQSMSGPCLATLP